MRQVAAVSAAAILVGCAPKAAPEVRCPDQSAEIAALTERIDELVDRLARAEAQAQRGEVEIIDRDGMARDGDERPVDALQDRSFASIGVPLCDTFAVDYEVCIRDRFPDATKETSLRALHTSINAWRKAAESPAGREGLEMACATARDAVAEACGWDAAAPVRTTGDSKRKRVPRVRQSKATVVGALDKDIIRRIVRAHINEVRYCYNQGLVRKPDLEGRVTIKFTISPTGDVDKSDVNKTTVEDKNVGRCIAKAVKRWQFPEPDGGGVVVVSYPFVLAPG
ncbi:MAG: AgmX/PglI C-terminal domain-containing protein [Myxococcota bacterium]